MQSRCCMKRYELTKSKVLSCNKNHNHRISSRKVLHHDSVSRLLIAIAPALLSKPLPSSTVFCKTGVTKSYITSSHKSPAAPSTHLLFPEQLLQAQTSYLSASSPLPHFSLHPAPPCMSPWLPCTCHRLRPILFELNLGPASLL
jgi:hypothetical protein